MLLTKEQLHLEIGKILTHAIYNNNIDWSEDPNPRDKINLTEEDALIDEISDYTIDCERPTWAYDDVRGSVYSHLYDLNTEEMNFNECLNAIVKDILDYRERITKEGR